MFSLNQSVTSSLYGSGTIVAIDGSCNYGMPVEGEIVSSSEKYPVAAFFEKYPFGFLTSRGGVKFSVVFTADGESQGNGTIAN